MGGGPYKRDRHYCTLWIIYGCHNYHINRNTFYIMVEILLHFIEGK